MTGLIIVIIVFFFWLTLLTASFIGFVFKVDDLVRKVDVLVAHNVALLQKAQNNG